MAAALAGWVLLAGAAKAGPSAGGLASDQVEYVSTVSLRGHANGGRLHGSHFYATTASDLAIFDVSRPDQPREVGRLSFGGVDLYYRGTGYQEDPDTNGSVLLRAGVNAGRLGDTSLKVVDVRDPTRPFVVGTLADVDEHTISCVLNCTWAYGTFGSVIDIRDPAAPRRAGNWISDRIVYALDGTAA